LVAAAAMPDRDAALVIAAALFAQRTQERLLRLGAFRQLREIADARSAASCGNRVVFANSHNAKFQDPRSHRTQTFSWPDAGCKVPSNFGSLVLRLFHV